MTSFLDRKNQQGETNIFLKHKCDTEECKHMQKLKPNTTTCLEVIIIFQPTTPSKYKRC